MQWLRNAAYILIVILGGGFLLLEGRDILFPFLFAIFFRFPANAPGSIHL
jgi:hypothetical protein